MRACGDELAQFAQHRFDTGADPVDQRFAGFAHQLEERRDTGVAYPVERRLQESDDAVPDAGAFVFDRFDCEVEHTGEATFREGVGDGLDDGQHFVVEELRQLESDWQQFLADLGDDVGELGPEDALLVGEAFAGAGEVALRCGGLFVDRHLSGADALLLGEGAGAVVDAHLEGFLFQRGVVEQHPVAAQRFRFAAQRGADRFDGFLRAGVVERRQIGRETDKVGGESDEVVPGETCSLAENGERVCAFQRLLFRLAERACRSVGERLDLAGDFAEQLTCLGDFLSEVGCGVNRFERPGTGRPGDNAETDRYFLAELGDATQRAPGGAGETVERFLSVFQTGVFELGDEGYADCCHQTACRSRRDATLLTRSSSSATAWSPLDSAAGHMTRLAVPQPARSRERDSWLGPLRPAMSNTLAAALRCSTVNTAPRLSLVLTRNDTPDR